MTTPDTDTLKELRRPMAPEAVEFRLDSKPGPNGARVVPYIDARAVVARLNEICDLDWSDAYRDLNSGVECTLIVEGHPRADAGEYGTGPAGKGPKAAYSDALKRAATKFGIGAFLYAFPKTLMFAPTEHLRSWGSGDRVQWDLNVEGRKALREKYRAWITQAQQKSAFGAILSHGDLADDTESPDVGTESSPGAAQAPATAASAQAATPVSAAPPAAPEPWEVMQDLMRTLRADGLLNDWFVRTGYSKMNAAMWSALTSANRKVCLDWAERLEEAA